MVSQFLRLTKREQWKIVESDYDLMTIGKEYLFGENEDIEGEKFLDRDAEIFEDEDVVMSTVHHHHDDDDDDDDDDGDEMLIEKDDKHDVRKGGFGDGDVKGETSDKEGNKRVFSEEIVDALNFILSELNVQVS